MYKIASKWFLTVEALNAFVEGMNEDDFFEVISISGKPRTEEGITLYYWTAK
jgi:hypothetical protein